MIANLVTTLLLALGVATGNVSSNSYKGGNAFNHVEKLQEKPITKNAEITNDYNLRYTTVESIYNTTDRTSGKKQYLTLEGETNNSSNLLLTPFLITNTFYSFSNPQDYAGTILRDIQYYQILKFVNYMPSQQTITLHTYTTIMGSGEAYYNDYVYSTTSEKADNLIDQTLNASVISRIKSIITEISQDGDLIQLKATNGHINTAAAYLKDDTFPTIILEANETKTYILYTYITIYYDVQNATTEATRLQIQGHYITETPNYEIVDVPNLMFTILTLPFAWYSTAFNLTIFPNTPYSLNFGNLVMVIVAAMILLYLIKKVIK